MSMRRGYKRKKGKKIVKTKKVLKYNDSGVEFVFKSGLELYCYKQLKASGLDFKYEPTSFELVPKEKLHFDIYKKGRKQKDGSKPFKKMVTKTSQPISYKPDFVIYYNDEIVYVIETKGYANESFAIRVKLWYSYCCKELNNMKAYFLPSNQKEVDSTISTILEDVKGYK